MSDEWLSWLVTAGQIGAIALAILAAVAGGISGYAGRELSRRSDAKLAALRLQVGTVIGGKWEPLTSAQIDKLRQKIDSLNKVDASTKAPRIQVMYENAFGKDLAGSIALAFQAAKWDVVLGPGSGFENGIKVGPGPVGLKLREIIAEIAGTNDVTALRPQEQDRGFYFVGVGAKIE
jgi:hypothetical protein